MKFAIKFDGQFFYDGTAPRSIYDTSPWVSADQDLSWQPTVYSTRERAEQVVAYWFNHNDHPDYVDGVAKDGKTPRPATKHRYSIIGGRAVGQYLRTIDNATKKAVLTLNPGPFPEVVEVADDFGRPDWNER